MGVLSRGRVVEADHNLPYTHRYVDGSTYNDTISIHVVSSKVITREEAKKIKEEIAAKGKQAKA